LRIECPHIGDLGVDRPAALLLEPFNHSRGNVDGRYLDTAPGEMNGIVASAATEIEEPHSLMEKTICDFPDFRSKRCTAEYLIVDSCVPVVSLLDCTHE